MFWEIEAEKTMYNCFIKQYGSQAKLVLLRAGLAYVVKDLYVHMLRSR